MRFIALIVILFGITACVTITEENEAYLINEIDKIDRPDFAEDSILYKAIEIGRVSGTSNDPDYAHSYSNLYSTRQVYRAISSELQARNALADNEGEGTYIMHAHVLTDRVQGIGWGDLTFLSEIEYRLVDTTTGDTILRETINADTTIDKNQGVYMKKLPMAIAISLSNSAAKFIKIVDDKIGDQKYAPKPEEKLPTGDATEETD